MDKPPAETTLNNQPISILDPHCEGHRVEDWLRPSGGADYAGRERADPVPQDARLEAVGGVGQPGAAQAVGLATSSDPPGTVNHTKYSPGFNCSK